MIPNNVLHSLRLAAASVKGVRSSRHSALIVDDKGRVVSIGVNKYKTHPIMLQYQRNEESIYLHAEMDAIVKGMRTRDSFEGCKMYILRLNKKNEICCSKPCSGCEKALKAFGFKEVYWT